MDEKKRNIWIDIAIVITILGLLYGGAVELMELKSRSEGNPASSQKH